MYCLSLLPGPALISWIFLRPSVTTNDLWKDKHLFIKNFTFMIIYHWVRFLQIVQEHIQEFLQGLQKLMVQVLVNGYTFIKYSLRLLKLFILNLLLNWGICIQPTNGKVHQNRPLIWHEYRNVLQFVLVSRQQQLLYDPLVHLWGLLWVVKYPWH